MRTPLQQDYATFGYTASNKLASVTDANGALAAMSYDALDRQARWYFPSKTTAGVASTTDYEEYGYDANGNRTGCASAMRACSGSSTTRSTG